MISVHSHFDILCIAFTYILNTNLTISSVSQLCTDHCGLQLIPEVITHCAICIVVTHFNSTLHRRRAIDQTNIPICTPYKKSIIVMRERDREREEK